MHRDNVNRAKTALAGCVLVLTVLLALVEVTAAMAKTSGSGPTRVSRCSGSSSEAAQAADPHGKYVYEAWMGCGRGGIAFARSTDGGAHFSTPVRLPGSAYGSYDPDLSVSAQGKLYAS
ncbi:MAG: hypothetical protein J2O48_13200, partial [Solirubrobacterales bacterium]|nr:hypothetical protein [Solirubrobacterales bacterium]